MQLVQSFQNCFKIPDLRRRILFTLGLLIVYRIGGQITVPGVELVVLKEYFESAGNTLFGCTTSWVVPLPAGRSSLWASCPISAPRLSCSCWARLFPTSRNCSAKEKRGVKKSPSYTRYGTVFSPAAQSYGVSFFITSIKARTRVSRQLPRSGYWLYTGDHADDYYRHDLYHVVG